MSSCPKCQHTLRQFDYKNIELSRCVECRGFWFQDGQFREVKQIGFAELPDSEAAEEETEAESASSDSAEEPALVCPECEESFLMPYSYAYSSGIQLHRCAQCHGIWAENSALSRIEKLLNHYQESLEEAKSKALPLMMKVKDQIQQAEREQEKQKQKKKGVFNRLFGSRDSKNSKNTKVQNIFDTDDDDDRDKH